MKREKIYLIRLPLVCNFNCRFCFLEKREINSFHFNLKDFFRLIDEAKKTNSTKIVFAGGEPTLIKELPLLISYAKKRKIPEVQLQTNGLKCSYENYVQKLKKAGLDSVLVGFHSHQEFKFNFLTRTRGYFSQVLMGIKNLFKYKIEVSFNHTITSLTYRNLEEYVKFILKNFPKPKSIFLTFVYPTGQCWKNKYLIPKVGKVAPYFLKALKYCLKNQVVVKTPHCGMPGFPLCLLKEEEMNLEKLISSGRKNIKTKEFNCVNIKLKRCQECKYDKKCVGISLNYIKLYGSKEFKPVRK